MTLSGIAKAWGVTKQTAASTLKRRGVQPTQFANADEAQAWRVANVPARTHVKAADLADCKLEVAKCDIKSPPPTTSDQPGPEPLPPTPRGATPLGASTEEKPPVFEGDFETRMVLEAEDVAAIANREVRASLRSPMMAAVSVKNWGAAMREVASLRDRFTKSQLERRELLSLDDALEAVSVLLGSLRRRIVKLGERAASNANPADPAAAKAAIDREVDLLMAEIESADSRTAQALSHCEPKESVEKPETQAETEAEGPTDDAQL